MRSSQKILQTDELVGAIHDRLLDDAKLDLANAFDDACVEIAELYREIERLERSISFGFSRRQSATKQEPYCNR